MSKKVLTVSIAAYNVERFIDSAIKSLITERDVFDKIEVLVIDDGSHDGTKRIADSYAALYPDSITVIKKENGGWGSTVNCGIDHARGKYFKLLDADDWYDTNNLEGFISFLENADADIVLTPLVKVYQDISSEVYVDEHDIPEGVMLDIAALSADKLQSVEMHEMAVKTELLKDNRVTISEHYFYTDQEFDFFSLLYAKTLMKFSKVIYYYRLGNADQSVSPLKAVKNRKDIEYVSDRLAESYLAVQGDVPGPVRFSLMQIVARTFHMRYRMLLLANAPRKELAALDKAVKSYDPELYRYLGDHYKKIGVLRRSRYYTTALLCMYIRRKSRISRRKTENM